MKEKLMLHEVNCQVKVTLMTAGNGDISFILRQNTKERCS